MKRIIINEILNVPLDRTWELFTDLDNYPKYFKYVHKIFHKGEMKSGSTWYDFATFVAPLIVKHKTVVFEKVKALGFDVYIPLNGYVRERINLLKKDKSTIVSGYIEFDFGNPIFKRLFDNLFETRMRESIKKALTKVRLEAN